MFSLKKFSSRSKGSKSSSSSKFSLFFNLSRYRFSSSKNVTDRIPLSEVRFSNTPLDHSNEGDDEKIPCDVTKANNDLTAFHGTLEENFIEHSPGVILDKKAVSHEDLVQSGNIPTKNFPNSDTLSISKSFYGTFSDNSKAVENISCFPDPESEGVISRETNDNYMYHIESKKIQNSSYSVNLFNKYNSIDDNDDVVLFHDNESSNGDFQGSIECEGTIDDRKYDEKAEELKEVEENAFTACSKNSLSMSMTGGNEIGHYPFIKKDCSHIKAEILVSQYPPFPVTPPLSSFPSLVQPLLTTSSPPQIGFSMSFSTSTPSSTPPSPSPSLPSHSRMLPSPPARDSLPPMTDALQFALFNPLESLGDTEEEIASSEVAATAAAVAAVIVKGGCVGSGEETRDATPKKLGRDAVEKSEEEEVSKGLKQERNQDEKGFLMLSEKRTLEEEDLNSFRKNSNNIISNSDCCNHDYGNNSSQFIEAVDGFGDSEKNISVVPHVTRSGCPVNNNNNIANNSKSDNDVYDDKNCNRDNDHTSQRSYRDEDGDLEFYLPSPAGDASHSFLLSLPPSILSLPCQRNSLCKSIRKGGKSARSFSNSSTARDSSSSRLTPHSTSSPLSPPAIPLTVRDALTACMAPREVVSNSASLRKTVPSLTHPLSHHHHLSPPSTSSSVCSLDALAAPQSSSSEGWEIVRGKESDRGGASEKEGANEKETSGRQKEMEGEKKGKNGLLDSNQAVKITENNSEANDRKVHSNHTIQNAIIETIPATTKVVSDSAETTKIAIMASPHSHVMSGSSSGSLSRHFSYCSKNSYRNSYTSMINSGSSIISDGINNNISNGAKPSPLSTISTMNRSCSTPPSFMSHTVSHLNKIISNRDRGSMSGLSLPLRVSTSKGAFNHTLPSFTNRTAAAVTTSSSTKQLPPSIPSRMTKAMGSSAVAPSHTAVAVSAVKDVADKRRLWGSAPPSAVAQVQVQVQVQAESSRSKSTSLSLGRPGSFASLPKFASSVSALGPISSPPSASRMLSRSASSPKPSHPLTPPVPRPRSSSSFASPSYIAEKGHCTVTPKLPVSARTAFGSSAVRSPRERPQSVCHSIAQEDFKGIVRIGRDGKSISNSDYNKKSDGANNPNHPPSLPLNHPPSRYSLTSFQSLRSLGLPSSHRTKEVRGSEEEVKETTSHAVFSRSKSGEEKEAQKERRYANERKKEKTGNNDKGKSISNKDASSPFGDDSAACKVTTFSPDLSSPFTIPAFVESKAPSETISIILTDRVLDSTFEIHSAIKNSGGRVDGSRAGDGGNDAGADDDCEREGKGMSKRVGNGVKRGLEEKMMSSNMHNCSSSHHYQNPLHRDHALQSSLTHFFSSNQPSSSSPLVSRPGTQLTKLARKDAITEGRNGGRGRTVPQCFSSFIRPFLSPISSPPLCPPSAMSRRAANSVSGSSNNFRMTEIANSPGNSSSTFKNRSFGK